MSKYTEAETLKSNDYPFLLLITMWRPLTEVFMLGGQGGSMAAIRCSEIRTHPSSYYTCLFVIRKSRLPNEEHVAVCNQVLVSACLRGVRKFIIEGIPIVSGIPRSRAHNLS